ncbi:hypothetical protein SAMN05660841_02187 [Sphingobacterium nematocida]|uniref:Uncharacterized protein n=1 Tax=Sphingobacterium nematocida TaxID=1513896 RepID=A0A1T5DWT2_9SPHI|nr:hypothetical protein [Sphingobacterium nematocida]SKB76069.1 hypothetical protein SAMN05660841_02187 [Sphingobacterium nematocida]
MISTITPLQEAVEQQLLASRSELSKPDLSIDEICAKVLDDMFVLFRQIKTPEMASQLINQCYVLIRNLLDQLWSAPDLFSSFEAVEKLYFRFELSFGFYIQPGNTPPLFLQQQLSEEIKRRLPAISSKLLEKAIPELYILELGYGIESLLNPGKQPQLCYAHLDYIPKLLGGLEQIARDNRDKVWVDRYVFLMIRFNFNYPGFFNRWSEHLTKTLKELDTGRAQKHLFHIERQLTFSYHSGDLCYNLSQEPLLEQMLLYVDDLLEKFTDSVQDNTTFEETSLLTKLNGDELNLIFYYFYKFRIYDYPNKREAAKAFSNTIQSISKQNISYKTLEKFEKSRLEASAIKMKRLLKAVVEAIDQDFKH